MSDEATRQEFEALLVEGLSARAAARAVGISPSTGIAWAAKWKQKNDGTPEGPVGADEERVANLLLAKAELLLSGIVNEPGSKAKLEVAGAVEKLLGKYLSFVGKATEQHVTIDGQSSADLDKLLKQLLPEGSGVV